MIGKRPEETKGDETASKEGGRREELKGCTHPKEPRDLHFYFKKRKKMTEKNIERKPRGKHRFQHSIIMISEKE